MIIPEKIITEDLEDEGSRYQIIRPPSRSSLSFFEFPFIKKVFDSEKNEEIRPDDIVLSVKSYSLHHQVLHLTIFYFVINVLSFGMIWLFGKKFTPYLYVRLWSVLCKKEEEATHVLIHSAHNGSAEILPIECHKLPHHTDPVPTFLFRSTRFLIYNKCLYICDVTPPPQKEQKRSQFNGMILHQAQNAYPSFMGKEDLTFLFGKNELKSLLNTNILLLLIGELVHPFFIFQIFSIILWCFDNYYIYAIAIGSIAAVTLVLSVGTTYFSRKKMKRLFNAPSSIKALNAKKTDDNNNERIGLKDLLPSQVVDMAFKSSKKSNNDLFPVDFVFLGVHSRGNEQEEKAEDNSGAALSCEITVNESVLTGESIPIIKQVGDICYAGTQFLSSTASCSDRSSLHIRGKVLKIAFGTKKGHLIHSLMYQKKEGSFEFYRDSFIFIAVMFVVSTLVFVFTGIRLYILAAPFWVIVRRGLDLYTIIVPPALPIAMEEGIRNSISKLAKKKITSLFPHKLNVATNISSFLFDKTGTLTQNEMVLKKVLPSNGSNNKLHDTENENNSINDDNSFKMIRKVMGCCHSISFVDNQLEGDPLELECLNSSRFIMLNENKRKFRKIKEKRKAVEEEIQKERQSGEEEEEEIVEIKKIFPFNSCLKRMSVITTDNEVFCKGAPEIITSLCIQETVPSNIHELISTYSSKGFRLLGCGSRQLQVEEEEEEETKMNMENIDELDREEVEKKFTFLGLLLFENPVQEDAYSMVQELESAGIRCKMVTGDHMLTAIQVAKTIQIIKKGKENLILSIEEKEEEKEEGMSKEMFLLGKTEEGETKLQIPLIHHPHHSQKNGISPIPLFDENECSFSISGTVFNELYENDSIFRAIFPYIDVFCRMKPMQKFMVVDFMKQHQKKLKKEGRGGGGVGFCGDGTNDCSAIQLADIGVSINSSSSSIISSTSLIAHFCVVNLSSIALILRQSKACLSNSLSLFKFIIMYSILQSTAVLVLYAYGTNLSDGMFLYLDLVIIVPTSILMSKAFPIDVLKKERPNPSLITYHSIVSLVVHFISFIFCFLFIYFLIPFHITEKGNKDFQHHSDPFPSIIFLLCATGTLNSAVAYSTVNNFFRKSPLKTNKLYIFVLFFLYTLSVSILLFKNFASYLVLGKNGFPPLLFIGKCMFVILLDLLFLILVEKRYFSRFQRKE